MFFILAFAGPILWLLIWLNGKYPKFKNFNVKYAGVVLYVFSLYSIHSAANMAKNFGGGKFIPSILWVVIVLVYGLIYRPNTLRLIGALPAYEGESQGWKFTTTAVSIALLVSTYLVTQSLMVILLVGVMLWCLLFCASIHLQHKLQLGYFSLKKVWVIFYPCLFYFK